jgi:hypothetical protein
VPALAVLRAARHYLWAAPVSVPAAILALLAACSGSTLSWNEGVLEASGGLLSGVLRRAYPPMSIAAITFGHVILAQSPETLNACRGHEQVHVRQYERWGPCFPVLYLLASLRAALQGKHPYLDNPFEGEARRLAP